MPLKCHNYSKKNELDVQSKRKLSNLWIFQDSQSLNGMCEISNCNLQAESMFTTLPNDQCQIDCSANQVDENFENVYIDFYYSGSSTVMFFPFLILDPIYIKYARYVL